jgi:hypothetical protein
MAKLGDQEQQLSTTFFGACDRMHQACTQLYEGLHKQDGTVNTSTEQVLDKISEYKKWMLIEADLIREAVREYNERGQ